MTDNFYTFEEVARLDSELFKLATYEVTEGMLVAPTDMGNMMSLQKSIMFQFNCFKRQIQHGETTFDHITQQVLSKHGPFEREDLTIDENNIDQIIDDADKSYKWCKAIDERIVNEQAIEVGMAQHMGNLCFTLAMPDLGMIEDENTEDEEE